MTPPVQLELATVKRDWIEDVAPRVAMMLPRLGVFTADDLRGRIPEPENPNWIGCMFARLRNTGLIQEAGRVASTRPSANKRKITAWEMVKR